MPVAAGINNLFQQFKKEFSSNGANCEKLGIELKQEIAKLRNQLLLEDQPQDELALAREVYELSAFLAVKKNDLDAFERNVKQLKIYYRDFAPLLQPSANEYKILGLYLLFLLSSDRIGEFHMELELIPKHDSQFIQNPIQLERSLMEGNYAKINQSMTVLGQQEYYRGFLDQLLQTMRRRIADALGRSSHVVSVGFATKMLYLKDASELKSFVETLQKEDSSEMTDDSRQNWEIRGDKLHFREVAETDSVSAYDTISNVIGYATEIERIV